jgi:hypothetical protein
MNKLWILTLLPFIVSACVGGKSTGNKPGDQAGTASPAASPSPLYTGPAVLQRGTAAFAGHQTDANTFVTCANSTIALTASDTLTAGGTCTVEYEYVIASQTQTALNAKGLSGAKVGVAAVKGNAAVATFVKGNQSGRILFVRNAQGTWLPTTITTSDRISGQAAAAAGQSAKAVDALQDRLPVLQRKTPPSP